jgi:hypothetical protein
MAKRKRTKAGDRFLALPNYGAINDNDVLTASMLHIAITTCEWFRYEGNDDNAVTGGTTGPDAIDLRMAFPPWNRTGAQMPIEYRHVGADDWIPTGYAGRVSYDVERSVGEDTDGYRFYPYKVTDLVTFTV